MTLLGIARKEEKWMQDSLLNKVLQEEIDKDTGICKLIENK